MVGAISSHLPVMFVDIRPAEIRNVKNLSLLDGSLLALPVLDNSIKSLSCMHFVEYIGLGYYGDPLDPMGTIKAIKELIRILAPKGELFFSAPIGVSRLCINAHRIRSVDRILEMFSELELLEFSYVNDTDQYILNADPTRIEELIYGCGLFLFRK
ncbi:MAG: DUF268 domain-containing protein [Anaerolineaceae bacterium]|nr:DUF268 domain-containing protein [Anaerolineaceae bacterium]